MGFISSVLFAPSSGGNTQPPPAEEAEISTASGGEQTNSTSGSAESASSGGASEAAPSNTVNASARAETPTEIARDVPAAKQELDVVETSESFARQSAEKASQSKLIESLIQSIAATPEAPTLAEAEVEDAAAPKAEAREAVTDDRASQFREGLNLVNSEA